MLDFCRNLHKNPTLTPQKWPFLTILPQKTTSKTAKNAHFSIFSCFWPQTLHKPHKHWFFEKPINLRNDKMNPLEK